jgi:anti-sigma factor RsiW
MICKDIPDLVHAYADGELSGDQADALEAHLRDCADCTRLVEAQRGWQRTVRAGMTRFAATDRLRARLAVALTEADDAAAAPRRQGAGWRPLAMAASLAFAIVASSGLTAYYTLPDEQDRMLDNVVSGHVRSLMASHLTDVPSSDQHTVKPWFHGRIDLAPPVDDLAPQGYKLVGGRLDYLDRQPAAALVYQHREHPINLFVVAAPTQTAGDGKLGGVTSLSERGYNVLHWNAGGMAFWAVSDLDLAELKDFARLYQASGTAPPQARPTQ